MKWLRVKLQEFRDWLKTPPHDLPDQQRTLRWWVDLGRHGVTELKEDRASQMAAALTYHTLFSLLPTLVLTMLVLQALVNENERAEFKHTVVNWLVSPMEERVQEEVGSAAQNERRQEFLRVRESLDERFQEVLDRLEYVDLKSIGIAGVLLFLYAATGLLTVIEGSFNTVYGARQGRPLLVRLPSYYTVMTLAPICIIGGQVLQRNFLGTLERDPDTVWLVAVLAQLTPVLVTWLVLGLMYMLLPNTKVSLRTALIGSFTGAVIWLVAARLFSIYVQRAAASTLYGALGLLPLFLLWMWASWLIILFGLEVSYTLQSMHEGRFRHGYERSRDQNLVDRTWLLPVAAAIADRFQVGKTATLSDLSRDIWLSEETLGKLADALVAAGLVNRIRSGRNEAFSLARPAESITSDQILAAGEGLLPDRRSSAGAAWSAVRDLNRDLLKEASTVSLADLVQSRAPSA